MSGEEAHHRPTSPAEQPGPAAPAAGGTVDDAVAPHHPVLTARTDPAAGLIRVAGHLDRFGAEALCRSVSALQELGHRRIVVWLESATIAEDASTLLAEQVRRLHVRGTRLLLR